MKGSQHLRRALVAALAVGLATTAWEATGLAASEHSGLTLVADFVDAGPLTPGNDVRVDGVRAGQVKGVELHQGHARVKFSVSSSFTPVHEDATLRIRPVDLLGEQFVDLGRGTPTAPPLRSGAVIPTSRTGRAVELQDVLNTVDEPTGTALNALVVSLGEGMTGHGQDVAAAVDALGPALEHTDGLLKILGGQNELLQALIDRAQPVASSLAADRGKRLDALVRSAGELLNAAAAARTGLDEGLRRLPGTLDTVRSALDEVGAVTDQATPLLRSLRPVTGSLRPIAEELNRFATVADPALASVDPLLMGANDLVKSARPVAADLALAGNDLERVARSARTLVEALPADLGNILDAVRNVALATAGYDGLAHYIRGYALAVPGSFEGALPMPTSSASSDAVSLPGQAVASESSPSPSPSPSPAAGGLGAIGDPGSATGLTSKQERSLLRYLLGVG